jgi:hypothetical protein
MSRRIKEYIDINDHASLDDLIHRLIELRAQLPTDAGAELRLRGDDIFGRKLSISYFRELTQEEAECEARYADVSSGKADRGTDDNDWRNVA